MQRLDEFDRMVMASLCPSGALFLPLLPPNGAGTDTTDGGTDDGGVDRAVDGVADSLLPLGLGIVAAIFLGSLAALA